MDHARELYANETSKYIRTSYLLPITVNSICHPLIYARVLMQLGHEPISHPGESILGTPVLCLPNIFQYVKNIKQVDGFFGCYRGLGPTIIGRLISLVGSETIALKLGFERIDYDNKPNNNEGNQSNQSNQLSSAEIERRFFLSVQRELVLLVSSIIISHPFHVISVRMMAQFVGKETMYETIWSSIKDIWNTEGIFGFFYGLVPKLFGEVSFLLALRLFTFSIIKDQPLEDNIKVYIEEINNYLFAAIFYPFNVITTCIEVTGSSLKAGQPPLMPKYKNWLHCMIHLGNAGGDIFRGMLPFFRYADLQK